MSADKLPETLDEAQAEIRRLRAELSRTKGQLTRAWRDRKDIHGKYEAAVKGNRTDGTDRTDDGKAKEDE